mmetsp:Transcript_145322/g.378061  ORF Transcript_145322/g.378061 Transcript_145322/m.378061 type:complete len:168 (+) Transcript_145322:3-506(+)
MLYKTQMCWFFEKGCCTRNVCRFGHGEMELRPKPNLVKTRMCHFVRDRGFCRDRQCNFAHDAGELRDISHVSTERHVGVRLPGYLEQQPQTVGPRSEPLRTSPAPAPACIIGINMPSPPPPGGGLKFRPLALTQIDFQKFDAEELFVMFRSISPEQLLVAQPKNYLD